MTYRAYIKDDLHIMKSVLINFTEETIKKMDELVTKGEYNSRSELIRDSVRKTLKEQRGE